ncbi:predicted protein, partial [Nematostella vectensis]
MAIAFFKFASALFTRVIFFVHGFVSVYLVWLSKNKDSTYWWLSTGLVLLFFETIYTILMRKGKEYKYFWPSSLLYMATVLPSIWVAEMSILHAKQTDPNCESNSASTVYALGGGVGIAPTWNTLTQKWSKLGLILVIIVARWLLPRGELTRDQLSTLLLVYVANAADIMGELSAEVPQAQLAAKTLYLVSVLVTYTWCFMQFTLVFTATAKSEPDEVTKQVTSKTKSQEKKLRLHGDLYSILTIMLMQDGPFLVLRLVMLVQFRVDSEMHLFFTGKNAMALAVLFYRLLVL